MNRTALIVNNNVLDTAETTFRVTRKLVNVIEVVLLDGTVNTVNIDVLVTVLTMLHVTRGVVLVTEDVLLGGLALFVKKVIFNPHNKNFLKDKCQCYIFEGVLELKPVTHVYTKPYLIKTDAKRMIGYAKRLTLTNQTLTNL